MNKNFPSSHVTGRADFERLYRLQVEELIQYALFLIDLDGTITSWNAGVEAILQYKRDEFVGLPLAHLFTPEDRAAGIPEQEIAKAAKEGRASDVRLHVRRDGSQVFVDGTLNAVRDDTGGLVGFSKVMQDATEKHNAEVALRDSEAFARSIVESSPDRIEVLTLEGKVQSMNQGARRYMEVDDTANYLGALWLTFWEGGTRTAAEQAVVEARAGRQSSFEGFCKTFKGKPKWWEVVVTPISDALGKPATLLCVSRDITDRRGAEQVLQRSHDDLAAFAHVVSHDLQAPLRTMKNYVQLLARRYQGQLDEEAHKFIGFILDGSENMEQLIQGLLRYAESGVDSDRQRVDLEHVIELVRMNLKTQIEESGAKIAHGELPCVNANPIQIQQLFQNLIGNAVKYRGQEEPRIYIHCDRINGSWLVSVSDNGVGIEREYYDRVFLPLKRLHGSEIAGTGLGLAVCKRIVEREGGRIWVESTPGRGSTFRFTLAAED